MKICERKLVCHLQVLFYCCIRSVVPMLSVVRPEERLAGVGARKHICCHGLQRVHLFPQFGPRFIILKGLRAHILGAAPAYAP